MARHQQILTLMRLEFQRITVSFIHVDNSILLSFGTKYMPVEST